MSASTERPVFTPGDGPISQMVAREIEAILATFESVLAAWQVRALPKAALALAWLTEQLDLHMRWEEESLFEELEPRCDLAGLRRVQAHHRAHESLQGELQRITELMKRRQGRIDGVDSELDLALGELELNLAAHACTELDEVCRPLDDALEEKMVATIHTELAERGRIH